MRRKFDRLALCSFILALAIYVFAYILYHYLSPAGGFSPVFLTEPTKPFLTLLFGTWGVCFHFASVMSFLIGRIFFPRGEISE